MQPVRINPIYLLVGLILPVLFIILLLRFAKILWLTGMVFAPVLLAIAFFINKKPLSDHLKLLGTMLRADPIKGIFYTFLSLLGLPFLSLFFIGKGLVLNKITKLKNDPNDIMSAFFGQPNAENSAQIRQSDSEYADYEEIETISKEP